MPDAFSSPFLTFLCSPAGLFTGWLLLMNVATFLVFGADKWKATHASKRRIPERNLLLSAALGGSVGALLGMKVWRHKTLHKVFTIGIPFILLAQIILCGGLYLYWNFMR